MAAMAKSKTIKITKAIIDGIRPDPDGEEQFLWDAELRGFAVRIMPSGRASYFIQYRNKEGRTRRHAFGKVGTMTPHEARVKARKLLVDVEAGVDHSAERREARAAMTVAELCELYLEAARAGLVMTRFGRPKRPSTIAIDEGRIARHVVPVLGKLLVKDLDRAAVQRLIDTISAGKTAAIIKTKARGKAVVTGGPGTAARVAELIGGVWSWAERRGYVSGVNPVRGVERFRFQPRDRTLDPAEWAQLGAVLRQRGGPRS